MTGHSLPMHSEPMLNNTHLAPKATVRHQNATRRYVENISFSFLPHSVRGDGLRSQLTAPTFIGIVRNSWHIGNLLSLIAVVRPLAQDAIQ